MAVGVAVNWPGHERSGDTIFVSSRVDDTGLRQISPSLDKHLEDSVYDGTTANIFKTFETMAGLSLDNEGNMYVTGMRTDSVTSTLSASIWNATTNDYGVT